MSTAQLISVDADEWARARRCPYTIQTALEHLVCTSENLTTHVCSEEVGGRQCGLLLGLHRRDKHDLSSKPSLPPQFKLSSSSSSLSHSSSAASSKKHRENTAEYRRAYTKRDREYDEDENGDKSSEEQEEEDEHDSDFLPSGPSDYEEGESVSTDKDAGSSKSSAKSVVEENQGEKKKKRRKRGKKKRKLADSSSSSSAPSSANTSPIKVSVPARKPEPQPSSSSHTSSSSSSTHTYASSSSSTRPSDRQAPNKKAELSRDKPRQEHSRDRVSDARSSRDQRNRDNRYPSSRDDDRYRDRQRDSRSSRDESRQSNRYDRDERRDRERPERQRRAHSPSPPPRRTVYEDGHRDNRRDRDRERADRGRGRSRSRSPRQEVKSSASTHTSGQKPMDKPDRRPAPSQSSSHGDVSERQRDVVVSSSPQVSTSIQATMPLTTSLASTSVSGRQEQRLSESRFGEQTAAQSNTGTMVFTQYVPSPFTPRPSSVAHSSVQMVRTRRRPPRTKLRPGLEPNYVFINIVTKQESVTLPRDFCTTNNYVVVDRSSDGDRQVSGLERRAAVAQATQSVSSVDREKVKSLYREHLKRVIQLGSLREQHAQVYHSGVSRGSYPFPEVCVPDDSRHRLKQINAEMQQVWKEICLFENEIIKYKWATLGSLIIKQIKREVKAELQDPSTDSEELDDSSDEESGQAHSSLVSFANQQNEQAHSSSAASNYEYSDQVPLSLILPLPSLPPASEVSTSAPLPTTQAHFPSSPQMNTQMQAHRVVSSDFSAFSPVRRHVPLVVPPEYAIPSFDDEAVTRVTAERDRLRARSVTYEGQKYKTKLPKPLQNLVKMCPIKKQDEFRQASLVMTLTVVSKNGQVSVCVICGLPFSMHTDSKVCSTHLFDVVEAQRHADRCAVCGCLKEKHNRNIQRGDSQQPPLLPPLPPLPSSSSLPHLSARGGEDEEEQPQSVVASGEVSPEEEKYDSGSQLSVSGPSMCCFVPPCVAPEIQEEGVMTDYGFVPLNTDSLLFHETDEECVLTDYGWVPLSTQSEREGETQTDESTEEEVSGPEGMPHSHTSDEGTWCTLDVTETNTDEEPSSVPQVVTEQGEIEGFTECLDQSGRPSSRSSRSRSPRRAPPSRSRSRESAASVDKQPAEVDADEPGGDDDDDDGDDDDQEEDEEDEEDESTTDEDEQSDGSPDEDEERTSCSLTVRDLLDSKLGYCPLCKREAGHAFHRQGQAPSPSPSLSSSPPSPPTPTPSTPSSDTLKYSTKELVKKDLPKYSLKADPLVFLRELERVFYGLNIHPKRKADALVLCMPDDSSATWVETHIRKTRLTWEDAKEAFVKQYEDKNRVNQLMTKIEKRVKQARETITDYTQDFMRLCAEAGIAEDNKVIISTMERGLPKPIRTHLAHQQATNMQVREAFSKLHAEDSDALAKVEKIAEIEWTTLTKLAEAAAKAEVAVTVAGDRGLPEQPRSRNTRSRSRNRKSKRDSDKESSPPPKHRKLESKKNSSRNQGFQKKKKEQNTNKNKSKSSNKSVAADQCYLCKKTDHKAIDCEENKKACVICKGSGHMRRDCPQFRPRSKFIHIPRALTAASVNQSEHLRLRVSCSLMPNLLIRAMSDTGAEFSLISHSLIRRFKLEDQMKAPPSTEPQSVAGVDKSMVPPRLGFIELRMTVLFPPSHKRASISFTKKFEVMDTEEESVLLGTECKEMLFPGVNFDGMCADKSRITDSPHDIVTHSISHPKKSVVRSVSAASASIIQSDDVEAELYDDDESEDECEPQVSVATSSSSVSSQ